MRIVDATASNTDGLKMPKRGCRARVGMVDGRTVGVGGWYADGPRQVVFLELREQARHHPVALMKALRAAIREASANGLPLQATVEENIPGAVRLLEHLGFVRASATVWELRNARR